SPLSQSSSFPSPLSPPCSPSTSKNSPTRLAATSPHSPFPMSANTCSASASQSPSPS
ncbi:hypothetical protein COCVIDRAFT_90720, partial [Bipolaris victoriae FI3]